MERETLPATQSALPPGAAERPRLSVVIPTRDEEAEIGDLLDHLLPAAPWEVIVVDAGSTDRTCAMARARGVRVITSAPGRGKKDAAALHRLWMSPESSPCQASARGRLSCASRRSGGRSG